MMSSDETSSPVSASTLAYLMRWPVLRLIWLKLISSVSDVAGYNATGQVTSESLRKPFQFARGAIDATPNTQHWEIRLVKNCHNPLRNASRCPLCPLTEKPRAVVVLLGVRGAF